MNNDKIISIGKDKYHLFIEIDYHASKSDNEAYN